MKLQSRDLVLFAQGCKGGPMLWDERPMEDGIHLRWGFRPELGYPLGGFDLYRRPHTGGDPICVGFSEQPGKIYQTPWQLDGVTLTSDQPIKITAFSSPTYGTVSGVALQTGEWVRVTIGELARWVRVTVVADAPVALTAYHGPIPVDQATATGTAEPESLVVEAAAIDAIELSHANGILVDVCHVPASQGASDDWELLNEGGPIALPITKQPDYPITHPNSPDDETEAETRVPPHAWKRYAGTPWQELHEQLEILVSKDVPIPMARRRLRIPGQSDPPFPPNTQDPEVEVWPLQQTLAASLDHNLARILGLYWLDETADPGQAYDYLIIGHWGRAGRITSPTASWVDFAQLSTETTSLAAFTYQGLIFTGLGLTLVEKASPWSESNQALSQSGWFGLTLPFQIRFPYPVIEVQLYIQTASPGATLQAFKGSTLVDSVTSATRDPVLSVTAPEVDYIELAGDQPLLFGISYLTKENQPGDRGWIVFNVRRDVPTPLAVPVGTRAVQVPGMPMLRPDGSVTIGANSLGVRWDLPVEHGAIEPDRAIMYRVQRQFLGAGSAPQSAAAKKLSDASPDPVLVTLPRIWTVVDEGTVSAPSQWTLDNGNLFQKSNIHGGSAAASDLPKPGTYALAGRLEWTDYQVIIRLRSDDDDAIGVLFRYQDEKNYYRFSMDRERNYRRLVKCVQGNYVLLWEDAFAYQKGQTYELKIIARGDKLQGWMSTTSGTDLLFDTSDGDLKHGLIGLYCWANTGAQFHHVRVMPPTANEPVLFEDDFTNSLIARLPGGWPTYPLYLLDQGLSDGWYAYRTAGIDIFGRVSDFSQPAVIQALDRTGPPPPLMVEAKALQPRPSGTPESVIDRMLTQAEQAWLQAHPEGGLKVQWMWPGELRRQAPDAAEFRIYFRSGQANVVTGRVTKVTADGPTRSILTTDQNTTLASNTFTDEWVRVGVNMFKVVGSSTGPNFTLTVENLRNPEHAANKKQVPEWVLPVTAAFSLAIGPDNPQYIDYRVARNWPHRLHIEPLGAIPTPSGQLTQREDHADDTCTVTTNTALADPQTADFPTGRTVPGVLISDGQLFFAEKHTSGANFKITVRTIENPTGTVRPVVGHGFVYYPGYRYVVTLPGLPLTPSAAEPMAYGQIGVSTADDKQHANDDPARNGTPWGNRHGNEGPVSPPQTVYAVKREPPAKPSDPPPEPEKVFAEPADYYGHSRYTVRWPRAEKDAALCYQVYRAVDSSLFNVDKTRWSGRPFNEGGPEPAYLVPGRWPTVAKALNKLVQANPDYAGLPRDALQTLASLPGNEAAFTLLTPEPLDPTNPSNLDSGDPTGQTMGYTDVLDGRANNRYFYRRAIVDRAGNRSELAASTPPIHLPDTTPPRAPLPVKALGGEKKVILTWQANRESDMDRYLIYRTTQRENSEDIRLMGDPVSSVQHQNKSRIDWTDNDLLGPMTYYYRLVAVRKGEIGSDHTDVVDLLSQPSEILAARAYDLTPPPPPQITVIEWVRLDEKSKIYPYSGPIPADAVRNAAVHLVWTSPDSNLTCLVQFRVGSETAFSNASGWLARGTYQYVHRNEYGFENQEYRIKVINRAGNANSTFAPATLLAAPVT